METKLVLKRETPQGGLLRAGIWFFIYYFALWLSSGDGDSVPSYAVAVAVLIVLPIMEYILPSKSHGHGMWAVISEGLGLSLAFVMYYYATTSLPLLFVTVCMLFVASFGIVTMRVWRLTKRGYILER